jgi:hypothetical protein
MIKVHNSQTRRRRRRRRRRIKKMASGEVK